MTAMVLMIIAGLCLFLFSTSKLSALFQQIAGDQVKAWILKFTNGTIAATITGIVVTALLDSSSAVIIISIVFVNAGLLAFKPAMGVVLGANIGTTIGSQIIAMDVGMYAPVLLLLGLVLQFFVARKKLYHTGQIIFYFGLLFFGLFTIENAVVPLRNEPFFTEWLQKANDPVTGICYGGFITLIIQSSSATVGMAIVLAKKGLLTLPAGVAVMMGAELGTCSDTLLATIKGSRAAIKTGLFHLIFNIICVLAGLLLFQPFVQLIGALGAPLSIERNIANAHLLFNGIGVLLFGGLIPVFEKLLNGLLPDKMPFAGA